MPRVEYWEPAPFLCGTCGDRLVFRVAKWPIPGAWHVHESDRRYHCYGRRFSGPDTATAPYAMAGREVR